jgi:hypothetical protein
MVVNANLDKAGLLLIKYLSPLAEWGLFLHKQEVREDPCDPFLKPASARSLAGDLQGSPAIIPRRNIDKNDPNC